MNRCPYCRKEMVPEYRTLKRVGLPDEQVLLRYKCVGEHITQPCDVCSAPVIVNAVSFSECFCSAECLDILYGEESGDTTAAEDPQGPEA